MSNTSIINFSTTTHQATKGWLEPMAQRMKEDPTVVQIPRWGGVLWYGLLFFCLVCYGQMVWYMYYDNTKVWYGICCLLKITYLEVPFLM